MVVWREYGDYFANVCLGRFGVVGQDDLAEPRIFFSFGLKTEERQLK